MLDIRTQRKEAKMEINIDEKEFKKTERNIKQRTSKTE